MDRARRALAPWRVTARASTNVVDCAMHALAGRPNGARDDGTTSSTSSAVTRMHQSHTVEMSVKKIG